MTYSIAKFTLGIYDIGQFQVATENKGFDIIIEMLADKSLPIDMDVVAQEGVIVVSILFH